MLKAVSNVNDLIAPALVGKVGVFSIVFNHLLHYLILSGKINLHVCFKYYLTHSVSM